MFYKADKVTDEGIIEYFARKLEQQRLKEGTHNTYYALDLPYRLENENYFAVCKKTATNYVTDVYKYDDVVEEAKDFVRKNVTGYRGRFADGFVLNDINYRIEFHIAPNDDITIVSLAPIEI